MLYAFFRLNKSINVDNIDEISDFEALLDSLSTSTNAKLFEEIQKLAENILIMQHQLSEVQLRAEENRQVLLFLIEN